MTLMGQALSLREIVRCTGGTTHSPGTGAARGVSTDSRSRTDGALFVALRGERFDGHDHLAAAFRRGAWGALVAADALEGSGLRRQVEAFPDRAVVAVADTERALGDLARCHREALDIRVVGITGSNGKSTTKEMTAAIVAERWRVHKNKGNLNNLIGLPLTVLELDERHEIAVLEMGMNRKGEIRRLAAIASPDVGVVTNVGPVHLEHLGTIDDVIAAKAELLEELGPAGTAVINDDDPATAVLRASLRGPAVTFGLGTGADVRADRVRCGPAGSSFTLLSPAGAVAVTIPFPGEHNVRNALAAAAAAAVLGVGLEEIREGLRKAQPLDMRFTELKFRGGIRVINDAYNANPVSMRAALDSLGLIEDGSRRAAVLGDMLELGGHAEEAHRDLGRAAGRAGLDLIVAVGEFAPLVAQGAREGGGDGQPIEVAADSGEAAEILRGWLRPGDLVLLKGSRGVGLERTVQFLRDDGTLDEEE
jgi:UDP-N-acetylmuramoyl-tripeptide--D-alanyl-D-alanine ligase